MADVKALLFTKSHEWIESDGTRRKVGISQFAAEQLGDVVYVEYLEETQDVSAGDEIVIVESTKATGEIYAPVAGRVVAVNKTLPDNPETVNADPYGEGWLCEIEPAEGADFSALMDHDAYHKFIEEEGEG